MFLFHSSANGSAFTTSSLPRSNDEATKQHHDWSSPGFPARSLVPAYKPTELHNQRTPPRLILDDDGSDIGDDRRSIDSASVVNLGDDENLSDILNSDDERALRTSSASSHFSKGIRNSGYIEESTSVYMEETNRAQNRMRRKSKSPSLANGSAKLSVNKSDVQEERKGSIISSDLSLDAGEQTVFLPVKKEKNTKKQEKQKKSKSFLSAANADKPIRRSSITPLNEDKGTRRNSATEVKASQKSLTVQAAGGEKRRKSITNATENDRKIATPKDTYTRGKKITKASPLENGTKSGENELLDVGESEGSGKNGNGRSITPIGTHRKSISTGASGGDGEGSGRNQKKINATSATPLNERRKSAIADVEQRESSGDSKTKTNGTSIPLDNGHKNAIVADDSKRKKKKQKTKKETKRKAVDSDDSLEEVMATLSTNVAGFNVTPATPEIQRRPSAVSQEKETKVAKKKKKRKVREGKKGKADDSEASGEDEMAEDRTKQLSVDIVAPETKRRKSVSPDEIQKKKKQKEATTSRRKSEIPGPATTHQETNGSFVQSAKSLNMDSLTVTPEKKRRKSLVIELEDMETKSQTSEEGGRRKSLSPDIPADWRRPGADQNVTRVQPNSISPIPTGYKSPRLIIKPSYHQY